MQSPNDAPTAPPSTAPHIIPDIQYDLEQCIRHDQGLERFYALLQTLHNVTGNNEEQLNAVLNSRQANLLNMAIRHKLPKFVYSLLKAKADPHFVDDSRILPLNRACWEKYAFQNPPPHADTWSTVIPEMLLHFHADVNALDFNGMTPLYIAVQYGNNELWRVLLHHNANPFMVCTPIPEREPVTCVGLAQYLVQHSMNHEAIASAHHFLNTVDDKYGTKHLAECEDYL